MKSEAHGFAVRTQQTQAGATRPRCGSLAPLQDHGGGRADEFLAHSYDARRAIAVAAGWPPALVLDKKIR
ncbi:MAG: hypothetical protein ACYC4S_18780 [Rhodoferax sp.]